MAADIGGALDCATQRLLIFRDAESGPYLLKKENMLNTEDLHAMIVNEGSDIAFTEEVSQNQIRLKFVPLHCSTSETILYYCFARSSSCHSVRFLVSALSWFNPFA